MAEICYERLTVMTLPRDNFHGAEQVLNDFDKLDLWSNRLDSEYPLDDINYCDGKAKKTHPFHKISKFYGKNKDVFCFLSTLRHDEYRANILKNIADRSSNNLMFIEEFTKKMRSYMQRTTDGESEAFQLLNDPDLHGFFSGYHADHPDHSRNIHETLSINVTDLEKPLDTSEYFLRTTPLMTVEKSELKKVKVFANGQRVVNVIKGEDGKRIYTFTTQADVQLEIGWVAKNSKGNELACNVILLINRGKVSFKHMKLEGDQRNWKLSVSELTKQNTSVVVKNKKLHELVDKLLEDQRIAFAVKPSKEKNKVLPAAIIQEKDMCQRVPMPIRETVGEEEVINDFGKLQLSNSHSSIDELDFQHGLGGNSFPDEVVNQQANETPSSSSAFENGIFNCRSQEILTFKMNGKQPNMKKNFRRSQFSEVLEDFEKLDFSSGPFDPNDKLNYDESQKASPFNKIRKYYEIYKDIFVFITVLYDQDERDNVIDIVKQKCANNTKAFSKFERSMNTFLARTIQGREHAMDFMREEYEEGVFAFFTGYFATDKNHRRNIHAHLNIDIGERGNSFNISDYFHRQTPCYELEHGELETVRVFASGKTVVTVMRKDMGQRNYMLTKLAECELEIKWKAIKNDDDSTAGNCRKERECLVVLKIKNGIVFISKTILDGLTVDAFNILELAKQNDRVYFHSASLYDTLRQCISDEAIKKVTTLYFTLVGKSDASNLDNSYNAVFLTLMLQDEASKERMLELLPNMSSDPAATREDFLGMMDLFKQKFKNGEFAANKASEKPEERNEFTGDVVATAYRKAVVEGENLETSDCDCGRCVISAVGIQPNPAASGEMEAAAALDHDFSVNDQPTEMEGACGGESVPAAIVNCCCANMYEYD